MNVRERYTPVVMAANTTVPLYGSDVGAFLCVTAGTITVVNSKGVTIVAAFPVSAGVYYPFLFYLDGVGGSVTTAGGASGTLGI